jgi:hypothetical protein
MHSSTGYNWELPDEDRAEPASLHANVVTPSLNPGPLRAHEWMHVVVQWFLMPIRRHDDRSVRITINGRELPGTVGIPSYYGKEEGEPIPYTPQWCLHSLQVRVPDHPGPKWVNNLLRLGGEISKPLNQALGETFPRNYSADATFDELYVWTGQGRDTTSRAMGLWSRGRYYRPSDTDPDDAVFTSQPLQLPSGRLLGIAWTAHAEDYGPVMYDYADDPRTELRPSEGTVADLWVEVNDDRRGPYRNEGYSPIGFLAVEEESRVQYRAKLKIGPATPSTILLSTPVLDDVTLYFDRGRPEFLSWSLE